MKTTKQKVRLQPGTRPDTKKDAEVLALRLTGLTFRAIGKETGQDVKSVYRRYKRVKEQLR